MNTIKYKLKTKGQSLSYFLMQSDSMYGHIFWAMLYIKGDEFLQNVLKEFREAKKETDFPFILSSMFPNELLPVPSLPVLIKKDLNKDEYEKLKKISSVDFIREHEWLNLVSDLSKHKLTRVLQNCSDIDYANEQLFLSTNVTHNSISRENNSTSEKDSGLFESDKFTINCDICFYIKVREEYRNILHKIIQLLCIKGFGPDASTTGYKLEVTLEDSECLKFSKVEGNAFISLSHCVGTRAKYYDIMTRYGRIFRKIDPSDKPFKQPILLFKPGAIFDKQAINELPQSVLSKIHKNEKIIHPAIPFLVEINTQEL
jgi:CRISPR-associated protein Csm4